MLNIYIDASTVTGVVKQIQQTIGGNFEERWGEESLLVDNDIAVGYIRFFNFDWGINLLEFNLRFQDDVMISTNTSEYNPINFLYCLNGRCSHGFNSDNNLKPIEQFQSVIISNKTKGKNLLFIPKDNKLELNIIQVFRKKFTKKRLGNIDLLNEELHQVFMDSDHSRRYSHFGTLNLTMAEHVKSLKNIRAQGMTRILQIEAKVYIILSLHIQQHNTDKKKIPSTSVLKRSELKIVRATARKIMRTPSKAYTLKEISMESGLSQAKLQEGFKNLYNRTVTEFIRITRLKAARELMNTTDLNISEIVYSIGFTSRSYFSKIFKEQYNITPNQYKKQITRHLVA